MIEEMGRVVSTEPGFAWIETTLKTTCGSCAASDGCSTSVVAKAFSPKAEHLRISVPCELKKGQSVKIGIPERHLLSASAWLYLLPVLTLLISAAILQSFTNLPEGLVILLSFISTFCAYWWVSRRLKSARFRQHYEPIFLGATVEPVISQKHEIPTKKS